MRVKDTGNPGPARTARTIDQLVDLGLAGADTRQALEAVADQFAVAITPTVIETIADDSDGPVARQFVPDARELEIAPGERDDPIGPPRSCRIRSRKER